VRLALILVVFAGSIQAGALTGGSLFFGGSDAEANLTGADFSATIRDDDVGPFQSGGLTPFTMSPMPQSFGVGFGSSGWGSGVTFEGVFYSPWSTELPLGSPYASQLGYSVSYMSPPPTITGPGVYPVSLALDVSFCLNNSKAVFYCESETGTAMGSFTATSGNVGNSWVFLSGLSLTVSDPPADPPSDPPTATSTPEPGTLGCVGLAICCGLAVKGARK
jgi:hypothetical protein